MSERLPVDVLRCVAERYFEVFDSEVDAKIIPVMLASKLFKTTIEPLLYRHVHLKTARQQALLSRASARQLAIIRVLTMHPCRHADEGHHLRPGVENCEHVSITIQDSSKAHQDPWLPAVRAGRKISLDRLECYRMCDTRIAWTAKIVTARQVVYAPKDGHCECPNNIDQERWENFVSYARIFSAEEWIMDISGPIRRAFIAGNIVKERPLQMPASGGCLSKVMRALNDLQYWATDADYLLKKYRFPLDRRIKVTCSFRPYAFWRRGGENPDWWVEHLFDFQPGEGCYGPKEVVDYFLDELFTLTAKNAIIRAGFQWTPNGPVYLNSKAGAALSRRLQADWRLYYQPGLVTLGQYKAWANECAWIGPPEES